MNLTVNTDQSFFNTLGNLMFVPVSKTPFHYFLTLYSLKLSYIRFIYCLMPHIIYLTIPRHCDVSM
jgi:hypothetical protein